MRGQIEDLARTECQEGGFADAALVEVQTVTKEGVAHCTPPAPKAKRVIGLSEAGLDELPALFTDHVANGVKLDRLVCGVGVLEFTDQGVVLRAVGPRLSARQVQEALPFSIYAAPDLKRID